MSHSGSRLSNPLPGRSRLHAPPVDGLERYGLPSKGEKRLLNFKTQEDYYDEIVRRHAGLHRSLGRRSSADEDQAIGSALAALTIAEDVGPDAQSRGPGTSSAEVEYSSLLLAMRKLRESLVATKRRDAFAVRVYGFNVRAGIMAGHVESYHPALLHLLRTLHRTVDVAEAERHEFVGYLMVDLVCRQRQPAEAFWVRNRHRYQDRQVDTIVQAVVHDNYHLFRLAKRGASELQGKLMEHAEDGMRGRAARCLERAYFQVDRRFLEGVMALEWDQLHARYGPSWESDGETITMRRPKRR